MQVFAKPLDTQQGNEQNLEDVVELPSLIVEETGNGELAGEEYDSILQIVVMYMDKEENSVPVQGGSGFLVGDEEQLQYLITTNEVVSVSYDKKAAIRKDYKMEDDADVQTQIKVVINKDVTIDAKVVTTSEEMDFAILQLSQPLHDRQALLLNDKSAEEYLRQSVSVLGYPSSIRYNEPMIYYTGVDLQKIEGFLETEEIINGQKHVKHHIFPNYGNLGGPIIDANNAVVALNQANNDGKNFYALQITEIMHVMDSLGIPYRTVTQQEEEEAAKLAEEEAAIVHKEALNSIVSAAEGINLADYKKDSYDDFDIILKEAKKIQENEEATQEDVDKVVEDMQQALDALVLKTPLKIVLSFVAACVFLVVLITFIILQVTKKKRKERKEKREAEFTVTEPAPVFQDRTGKNETSYRELVEAGNEQVANQNIWNVQTQENEDFEQTMVLSQSLLKNQVSEVKPVTLIRSCDNDNIIVHKFPFCIGKDKAKVDYCIDNNAAVSRVHATILYENNTYYIEDNHATNGTFINGKRLVAGSKEALKNGDKITLGNEAFDFRYSL